MKGFILVFGIKQHHRSLLSLDQLEAQLAANLDRAVGTDWTAARVKELIPCWYQTGDSLLPAVACIIDLEMPDPARNRTIVEVLNPLGSTDVFRDAMELDSPRKPH